MDERETGDVTSIDGAEVVVRHPGLPTGSGNDVRNDDSIVARFAVAGGLDRAHGRYRLGSRAGYFARLPPSTLRVIKVPHHGSLTSSTRVRARARATSGGRERGTEQSASDIPCPAVLARYREAGADIFRTDRDGAVMVTTDGHSIDVHTFTGRT